VEAFEDQLQGIRNIIDFSVAAPKRPSIFFTSSIAVAPYWSKRHPGKAVPEAPIHDLAVAELGYGESKLVAKLMLEKAGQICGTHSTVLRIGHIAGPVEKDGFWNKSEWIPTVNLNQPRAG
jgi:nucleoside-diphosphate-sugar epimerase